MPLRVAVVVDSTTPDVWIVEVLERLDDSGFAGLDRVLVVPPPKAAGQTGPTGPAGALLRLYALFDRRFIARARDGADASGQGARRLRSRVRSVSAEAAREELEASAPDVLLCFWPRPSFFTGCARHGVWFTATGDLRRYAGVPPAFWEIRDTAPTMGAVLCEERAGRTRVLQRTTWALDPVSVERNRWGCGLRLAQAVMLRLRQLHDHGPGSLDARAELEEPVAPDLVTGDPSLRDVVRFLRSVIAGALDRVITWRALEARWYLAYRLHGGLPPEERPGGFSVLEPVPGRFSADPFLLERGGRHYLFFEDYVDTLGRAVISYLELPAESNSPQPIVALEREHHLSYPFVFESEGRVYMLPESAAAGRVELFRAEDFPRTWVLERTLLEDVIAVDPTLVHHEGRLWLFVNVAADSSLATDDELHLFSASSLEGEWIPHPWNPVVSDVARARPAGRIFELNGGLVRPSQDCSRRYGYATVLNRIEVLSENEYRETPLFRIDPDWLPGALGIHTYARDGTYEVVDGYRRVSRLGRFGRPR